MHGLDPLIEARGTPEGALRLLTDVVDQLPVGVGFFGTGVGFPLLYRNRHLAARQAAPGGTVTGLDGQRLRPALQRVVAGEVAERVDLDLPGCGERQRWTLSPVTDDRGEVAAVLAVVEDAGQSLEHAKSRFLMLASHELRTPVTLLAGYVSMLADGSRPLDEVLPILEGALERLNVLVDQLMDTTRLSSQALRLERDEVDLGAALERIARRVAARWRRPGDLEVGRPAAAVTLLGDGARVETAIANLVDNAFKYSRPGDAVRCELRLEPGRARLLVSDQGPGLTDADLRCLFTRFVRGASAEDSQTAGTGLGLYLSREIARLHGGDVTAVSAAGRGSSFELTLPVGVPADTAGV